MVSWKNPSIEDPHRKKNKKYIQINIYYMKRRDQKDRKMLVFVEATGNGISGHVPRTRRAWRLSSKPDGDSRLEPERVLQKHNVLQLPAFSRY